MLKKLSFLIIILLSVSLTSFSQNNKSEILKGERAEKIVNGAELVRLKNFSAVPNYIKFRNGNEISAEKADIFINKFVNHENTGFQKLNSITGKLGMQHERYVQTINNIPLEYSAYIFHIKDGNCVSMNGNISSDPVLNGSFTISEQQALDYAKQHMNSDLWIFEAGDENPFVMKYEKPKAEKVYIPENGKLYSNNFRAAYKLDMFSLKPYKRHWVYIDAVSGKLLHKQTRIHTTDTPGTATTAYSGTQTITTDSYTGGYRLRESGRGNGIETYNCQNTDNYSNAVDFTDSDNVWDSFSPQIDQYATDAHFAAEKAYDYFYNIHSRNSIDGNGMALKSYIHYNLMDAGYPSNINAFWDGQRMTYGDGDAGQGISPLTTVDISAHEITHGLTSFTCNLVYQDEPGAINEAFSDIFGATVEFYAVPTLADWAIGEDIGYTMRTLSNPNGSNNPDTYLGNHWHTDASDNGGVHTNMGVLSYWYYLIVDGDNGTNDNGDQYNITGIGLSDAADIAFRMQTVYLTSTSEHADARFYGIKSAEDFHGECTNVVEQVTNAFYAVGIGQQYVPYAMADFSADVTESCQAPFNVQFNNLSVNANTYSWDFGDGTNSTSFEPSHTFTSIDSFDVKLTIDGGACGSDSTIKTNYIKIDPSIPCTSIMPASGSDNSDQCFGTLYDNGGPADNYPNQTDGTFTIAPSGASQITLDIESLDIESGSGSTCDYDYIAFYDGSSTSDPLINNTYYCNTTGNPGTINSTGGAITIEFHSDQAVNESGFKINWLCQQPNVPPVADFSASTLNSCNGRIQFFDESLNAVDSLNWDFGDGNTSTAVNPQHVYSQSGTYNVSLTVSNQYGSDDTIKTSYVNVNLAPAPAIDDTTVCENTSFILDYPALPADLKWYSDQSCTNLVHSGNYWSHPSISNNLTYYIREMLPAGIDTVGASDNTQGGGFFGNANYIHYLIFDAEDDFLLKSVKVNADGAGSRTITLRDKNQNTIESKTMNIPDGVSRIDLNFNVPQGQDLQLAGMGAPELYRTSNGSYLNYPYEINNLVSIKHSSANSDPYSYYYYFYDWYIEEEVCESETAVININVDNCTSVEDDNNSKISLFPNPAENVVYIEGINSDINTIDYKITDIQGRIIRKDISDDRKINIRDLKAGIYYLELSNDKINSKIKLIKQ